MYYRLKAQELVRCQRDVSCSLLDCVSLLNVPRDALGVLSSGKGLVSGSITLHTRGMRCRWSTLGGPEYKATMQADSEMSLGPPC